MIGVSAYTRVDDIFFEGRADDPSTLFDVLRLIPFIFTFSNRRRDKLSGVFISSYVFYFSICVLVRVCVSLSLLLFCLLIFVITEWLAYARHLFFPQI